MIQTVRRFLERLRPRPVSPEDLARRVGNTDALTAAGFDHDFESRGEGRGIPPNYVKAYDEGRPRK